VKYHQNYYSTLYINSIFTLFRREIGRADEGRSILVAFSKGEAFSLPVIITIFKAIQALLIICHLSSRLCHLWLALTLRTGI
jgi:hypothetical protein